MSARFSVQLAPARTRPARVVLAVLCAILLFGCKRTPEGTDSDRRSGLARKRGIPPVRPFDVTFLVAADTHVGSPATQKYHSRIIADMNRSEGRAYPPLIGGRVDRPRGVLLLGDLTEDGKPEEWQKFVSLYGFTGKDAPLRIPVWATWGNHDKNRGLDIVRALTERYGGATYAFSWDSLRVLCLGEAPDDSGLEWLEKELAVLGRNYPLVLYLHYPLLGPFSDSNWFGDGNYRDRLERILDGHNVLGIFHGHYHASERYTWRGHDVYNVGSPKHRFRSFAVVRITHEKMSVASWNYEKTRWTWMHEKPVTVKLTTANDR